MRWCSLHDRVGVVVPAMFSYSNSSKTLLTLYSDDYPKDKLEIVVVDGASMDGAYEEIARLFPHIRVNERRRFVAASRNIGEHGIATISWDDVHMGIPVIVNSELGIAEYISAFNAGVVVNRMDGEEEKNAIEEIKRNYTEYIKNCYQLSNYYDVKNHAERILRAIKEALST